MWGRRQTEMLQKELLLKITSNSDDSDLKNQAEGLDWSGVVEQYSEYTIKADQAKASFLRDKFRKGLNVAQGLHALTDVIPDEKGLSILKVGLAYVLMVSLSCFESGVRQRKNLSPKIMLIFSQAWKRHIETRTKILDTLANIPLLLANVYGKWASYKDDAELSRRVEEFDVMIFQSLLSLAGIIIPPKSGKIACE